MTDAVRALQEFSRKGLRIFGKNADVPIMKPVYLNEQSERNFTPFMYFYARKLLQNRAFYSEN